jgi:hypothetical protein
MPSVIISFAQLKKERDLIRKSRGAKRLKYVLKNSFAVEVECTAS